jgi:hypothetical protein
LAFLFQVNLVIHISLRKFRFVLAMRYGPIVYGLGILAVAESTLIMPGGKSWLVWISGFLYLTWGIYSY